MHLYRSGMPLALLAEFLGHENPKTILLYASADTEMKRKAIEKASAHLTGNVKIADRPLWSIDPKAIWPKVTFGVNIHRQQSPKSQAKYIGISRCRFFILQRDLNHFTG